MCMTPGEGSRKGDEGEGSQKEAVSGHGVSGSHLMSGVAHPKPEYPVGVLAHPKLGHPARVFTLCLFPVLVAVVQQSVGEVGRRSVDVRIR